MGEASSNRPPDRSVFGTFVALRRVRALCGRRGAARASLLLTAVGATVFGGAPAHAHADAPQPRSTPALATLSAASPPPASPVVEDCARSVATLGVVTDRRGTDGDSRRWEVYAGDLHIYEGGPRRAGSTPATRIAWGDLDADGRDELVIGLGESDDARLLIHDDRGTGFARLAERFAEWGEGHRVTALAVGNLDADPGMEIVVGRDATRGVEVIVLDDSAHDYRRLWERDMGRHAVRDLAIGDTDGDGRNEIIVACDGRPKRGSRSATASATVWVVQDATEGFAALPLASHPHVAAVAVGDLDGDGAPEIALGGSRGRGGRLWIHRYDPSSADYPPVAEAGGGWGAGRGVSALAFGDLDGDGGDELVVGRDGRCQRRCNARVLVYCQRPTGPRTELTERTDLTDLTELAALGTAWGAGRGVTALAIGDYDGDGHKDIAVGRSDGPGQRVVYFGDASLGYRRYDALGRGWRDDRTVRALATSTDEVCLHRPAEPVPDTVAEADAGFARRREALLRRFVEPSLESLRGSRAERPAPAELARRLFGSWRDPADGLHRILGGFAAMRLGMREGAELQRLGFVELANAWLTRAVPGKVGTFGDFDFDMMPLMLLLQREGDDAPGGRLTKDAQLRMSLFSCRRWAGFGRQRRTVPLRASALGRDALRARVEAGQCELSLSGSGEAKNLRFGRLVGVPETENHVLMINAWTYLHNEWLLRRMRDDEVIAAFVAVKGGAAAFDNRGSQLQEALLAYIGRILHNGMWETNAQPYGALSMRPLLLLASYAADETMRRAATNALDYLATKFAFQSLHGRRLAPMRRNWAHRRTVNLYDHDHVPRIFAALTGASVRDPSRPCRQNECGEEYGLFAALSDYRVDRLIHDFMLHPDNHREGFGAWARMHARHTERHYVFRADPVALAPFSRDLNARVRQGRLALEFTPELYFITQRYLNSAGGRREAYDGFPLATAPEKALAFVSRPTALLAGGDIGYWERHTGAENDVLLGRGNHSKPWRSENTGVYKNFALVYDTERPHAPFVLPQGWEVAAERQHGWLRCGVTDPESTESSFPGGSEYVLLCSVDSTAVGRKRGSMGFWEVVPRGAAPTAQALLQRVMSLNRAAAGRTAELNYTMVTTGETLTLNPRFGTAARQPAFLAIDGSTDRLAAQHLPAADRRSVSALPLLEVSQVDAHYRETGLRYAEAAGDGELTIRNPCLGEVLQIDSTDYRAPKRRRLPLQAPPPNARCAALRSSAQLSVARP